MQYVIFCDWLLSLKIVCSRFIRLVACIITSFLFLKKNIFGAAPGLSCGMQGLLVAACGV